MRRRLVILLIVFTVVFSLVAPVPAGADSTQQIAKPTDYNIRIVGFCRGGLALTSTGAVYNTITWNYYYHNAKPVGLVCEDGYAYAVYDDAVLVFPLSASVPVPVWSVPIPEGFRFAGITSTGNIILYNDTVMITASREADSVVLLSESPDTATIYGDGLLYVHNNSVHYAVDGADHLLTNLTGRTIASGGIIINTNGYTVSAYYPHYQYSTGWTLARAWSHTFPFPVYYPVRYIPEYNVVVVMGYPGVVVWNGASYHVYPAYSQVLNDGVYYLGNTYTWDGHIIRGVIVYRDGNIALTVPENTSIQRTTIVSVDGKYTAFYSTGRLLLEDSSGYPIQSIVSPGALLLPRGAVVRAGGNIYKLTSPVITVQYMPYTGPSPYTLTRTVSTIFPVSPVSEETHDASWLVYTPDSYAYGSGTKTHIVFGDRYELVLDKQYSWVVPVNRYTLIAYDSSNLLLLDGTGTVVKAKPVLLPASIVYAQPHGDYVTVYTESLNAYNIYINNLTVKPVPADNITLNGLTVSRAGTNTYTISTSGNTIQVHSRIVPFPRNTGTVWYCNHTLSIASAINDRIETFTNANLTVKQAFYTVDGLYVWDGSKLRLYPVDRWITGTCHVTVNPNPPAYVYVGSTLVGYGKTTIYAPCNTTITVTVKREHYNTYTMTINTTNKQYNITLTQNLGTITVRLVFPGVNNTDALYKTTQVTVQGKDYKKTLQPDTSGTAVFRVYGDENYTVRITSTENYFDPISMKAEPNTTITVSPKLRAVIVVLHNNMTVPVRIVNPPGGTLQPGQTRILITKQNSIYCTARGRPITIKIPPGTETYTYTLKPELANLTVIPVPPTATVRVEKNNQTVNITTGITALRLPPGSYTIAVTAPGYMPKVEQVTLKPGENKTITVALQKLQTGQPVQPAHKSFLHGRRMKLYTTAVIAGLVILVVAVLVRSRTGGKK